MFNLNLFFPTWITANATDVFKGIYIQLVKMKISIFLLCCIVVILSQEIEFDRELVSVLFDPWIFPGDYDVRDSYGETDIMKMITTISSKFDKILMLPIHAKGFNPGNSRSLIPSEAARFNKNRTKNQRQVEITMSYIPQLENNIHIYRNFDLQKKIADEANSIHNGTATSIVMYLSYLITKENIQHISDSFQYSRRMINSNSNDEYKFGVWLSMKDCEEPERLQQILKDSDFILFEIIFSTDNFKIEIYTQQIINWVKDCQEKISRVGLENKPEISFIIGLSESSLGGNQSLTFIKFWNVMNQWTKETHTKIVFFEAFDNFFTRPAVYNYCGWWRGKNGVNGTLLDFELEEKATVLKHGSKIINPEFQNFSRTNFIVVFESSVHHDHILINASGRPVLYNMLNTISTRFSKVVLKQHTFSLRKFTEGSGELLIINATAHWNAKKIAISHHPIDPMEVVITCSLELFKNSSEPTSFDIAKRLADEGNNIYPGTVKTIFIACWDLYSSKGVENAKSQLLYAKKIMSEGQFEYKLGMLLPINDCGKSRLQLQKWLLPVLPFMDAVLFHDGISDPELISGVASTFPLKFKNFERCLKKIQSYNKTVIVGFQTAWSDTNINGVENMTALVDYWKRANQWAVALNTTIVMFDAFDMPNRISKIERNQGWWKIDSSTKTGNAAEYIFVEKEELLKKEPMQPNTETSNKPSKALPSPQLPTLSISTIVVIVVVPSLIFLILIAGAAFMVYKRVMRKVEARCLTVEETRQGEGGMTLTSSSIFDAPYNQELEISKDDFTIDEGGLLGMGAFGSVFRAVIRTANGEMQAAVKMTMVSSPSSAVKSLLSEIKILLHVGLHENIVGIVGAHTTDIQQGGVLVFLELCPNGSLEKYLRNYNILYELQNNKTLAGSSTDSAYVDTIELADLGETGITAQLQKWSYEIACGMEFLAKKHVVHGDLAARNVLLTENNTAKISDFGLSRRMYDYTNYFKKQEEPLPWRWMAPESLRRLEFGEKSDIWAFGITLWEMYSFGDVPYPGLSWSPDFVKRLEQGLKSDQPRHAAQEFYDNILLKCWELLPSSRPTFAEMKDMLKLEY